MVVSVQEPAFHLDVDETANSCCFGCSSDFLLRIEGFRLLFLTIPKFFFLLSAIRG